MGTSLYGWVEVNEHDQWVALLNAGLVVLGDYDLYGALFGIRNYAHFRAPFAGRGLPVDVSYEASAEHARLGEEAYGASWVTHQELEAVDPGECALAPDDRVTEWRVEPSGEEVLVRKAQSSPGADEERVYGVLARAPDTTVRIHDRVYRRRIMRMGEALEHPCYTRLLRLMHALAQEYGSEHVRLVVWFAD